MIGKMVMGRTVTALALAATLAAGCDTMTQNPKQTIGTVVGGAAGGYAGSQFGKGKGSLAMAAAGAIAGALLGGEIGRRLDAYDRQQMESTAQQALEYGRDGQASRWNNPNSGNSGYVTPTRTYRSYNQDCREYETTVIIDGREETAVGRACRQSDGTWRIES